MIPEDVYVQKAIAGDDEAFDELIKRHRPKIYEVAHRMLGNPRDAEGITHASFSEARKHIKAFQFKVARRLERGCIGLLSTDACNIEMPKCS